MADADQLLADAESATFEGWDFSKLGNRLVSEPPHWDFQAIVADAAGKVSHMLDMGTSGGEWLSSLSVRARFTVATESWRPNVTVASARLAPYGVPVVYSEGAADNHSQAPGDPMGRLPFSSDAFDVITNRHESFRADEVARVLRRGGWFLTQQADSGSEQFQRLLGAQRSNHQEFDLDMASS